MTPKSDGYGHEYWWDGPDRFENVNRNVISWAQHEVLFNMISALAPEHIGLNIGGRQGTYRPNNCFSLNINRKFLPDIIGRGEQLPVKTNSLGFIISSHTLEHIKNTEVVLKEWIRVVIPGGLIAITLPDKNFFLHDPDVTADGEAAPSEMTPDACFEILKCFKSVELLLFNTRKNNFDFEVILRKKES